MNTKVIVRCSTMDGEFCSTYLEKLGGGLRLTTSSEKKNNNKKQEKQKQNKAKQKLFI